MILNIVGLKVGSLGREFWRRLYQRDNNIQFLPWIIILFIRLDDYITTHEYFISFEMIIRLMNKLDCVIHRRCRGMSLDHSSGKLGTYSRILIFKSLCKFERNFKFSIW